MNHNNLDLLRHYGYSAHVRNQDHERITVYLIAVGFFVAFMVLAVNGILD